MSDPVFRFRLDWADGSDRCELSVNGVSLGTVKRRDGEASTEIQATIAPREVERSGGVADTRGLVSAIDWLPTSGAGAHRVTRGVLSNGRLPTDPLAKYVTCLAELHGGDKSLAEACCRRMLAEYEAGAETSSIRCDQALPSAPGAPPR